MKVHAVGPAGPKLLRCRSFVTQLERSSMIKRAIQMLGVALTVTLTVALAMLAQGRGGGGVPGAHATPQIPPPNVTADRLLKAQQEPQNWLMYSGSYLSQRYSPLTQVTTANARDLELKWVWQSRSLEKHEVTPLVVDG